VCWEQKIGPLGPKKKKGGHQNYTIIWGDAKRCGLSQGQKTHGKMEGGRKGGLAKLNHTVPCSGGERGEWVKIPPMDDEKPGEAGGGHATSVHDKNPLPKKKKNTGLGAPSCQEKTGTAETGASFFQKKKPKKQKKGKGQ